MREIVMSKRLGDGRLVEVEVQEYTIGCYRCLVYVAGRWVDGPGEPQLLPSPRGSITHYLGGKTGGPVVALTASEAAEVSRCLDKQRARVGQAGGRSEPGVGKTPLSLHP